MAPPLDEHIHELAAPLAETLGLDIWGLELLQGPRLIVRLYVDARPGGEAEGGETGEGFPGSVSIDQCALLSRRLGLALEVEELIPSAYVLEVSSPGLERPFFRLEQLTAYAGRRISFALADPLPEWPGRKNFTGTLNSVDAKGFTLAPDEAQKPGGFPEPLHVPWGRVKKARLIHIFPDAAKARGRPKGAGGENSSGKARPGRAKKDNTLPVPGNGGLA